MASIAGCTYTCFTFNIVVERALGLVALVRESENVHCGRMSMWRGGYSEHNDNAHATISTHTRTLCILWTPGLPLMHPAGMTRGPATRALTPAPRLDCVPLTDKTVAITRQPASIVMPL
eukprot:783373-Amorphochlora_amoeboformis.AAC.1